MFKKFKLERVHFVYGLCLSLISSSIYFSNRSTNELRYRSSCKLEHIYLEGIPGKQNFYDTTFAHCWHDSLRYLFACTIQIKSLKRVSYEIQLLACKEIMRSIFLCLLSTNTINNVLSFFTS